jgi:predicted nucleic acid-binding protein
MVYADANLLARFYLGYDAAGEAEALLMRSRSRQGKPIPVTTLLRMELMNAFQRLVFETRSGGQWRVTAEMTAAAWAYFEEDLEEAVLFRPVVVTLEEISTEFESLSVRHTARHGFRTYDIMHVASALRLGCNTFWSFDEKARKLAKLEGLKTNA